MTWTLYFSCCTHIQPVSISGRLWRAKFLPSTTETRLCVCVILTEYHPTLLKKYTHYFINTYVGQTKKSLSDNKAKKNGATFPTFGWFWGPDLAICCQSNLATLTRKFHILIKIPVAIFQKKNKKLHLQWYWLIQTKCLWLGKPDL